MYVCVCMRVCACVCNVCTISIKVCQLYSQMSNICSEFFFVVFKCKTKRKYCLYYDGGSRSSYGRINQINMTRNERHRDMTMPRKDVPSSKLNLDRYYFKVKL